MIVQRDIFEHIGKPHGYDDCEGWQRFDMRRDAYKAYRHSIEGGHNEGHARYVAQERAEFSARHYANQNRQRARVARCGAKTKSSGKPCRCRPLPNKKRCRFHGGMSTGPKSLEGKIKALSSLKQYKARPDLLAIRVDALEAEYTAAE